MVISILAFVSLGIMTTFRAKCRSSDPGSANPALAREEPEVSELCATCILHGNVRKNIEPRIQKTINRFAEDKQAALEGFSRTPDIPLFLQYQDWPMCCGDWCEFVDVPSSYAESKAVPDGCNLHEADLAGADLRSADLSEAVNAEQSQFVNVTVDEHTKLPPGIEPPSTATQ